MERSWNQEPRDERKSDTNFNEGLIKPNENDRADREKPEFLQEVQALLAVMEDRVSVVPFKLVIKDIT